MSPLLNISTSKSRALILSTAAKSVLRAALGKWKMLNIYLLRE
jgi:hypothetical protein